jgi:lipopolysaccharide/colanic/teichoic acid biosynthesis glycosyltransferase
VQPTQIVIGTVACGESVPAGLLLRCKLQGIRITDAAALYEKLFARVCCERLQPGELLLSSALRGDSRTMAIQAVYNNVIGLAILLLLSPLLLAIAAAVALTSGAGPVFESMECAGFQYIPFRLQRFRTTRRDGSRTAVGRALRWLRLVNLPQLFNVVRGDMALVGPRPVRSEFARYLSAQMPFYAYRFSVKPGFGGWAQVHQLGKADPDTRREIEYDLYYIKQGSIWLDLEILLDRLVNHPRAAQAPKQLLAARH